MDPRGRAGRAGRAVTAPYIVQVNPATNTVQSRLAVGGLPMAPVATEHAVWVAVIPEGAGESEDVAQATLVRINF